MDDNNQVRNLTLETLRNRKRPTVSRPVDALSTPEISVTPVTPVTPEMSATPVTPVTPVTPSEDDSPKLESVKQIRRTLRIDPDANNLVKSMLGMGEGEVSIDVLVEGLLLFVFEQSEDAKTRVIEIAKSRASMRRERSLKVREQNRKKKSG